ncbi:MAG: 3'(2'),5'-bisphosphate nucleotidase CysQ [Pseudomonadota bacterium]|nr:3'(2'),5'-bisphosphate nucleotidase CysQ [Pseudomonadota bacterium]
MNQYDRRKLLSKITALANLAGAEIMKRFCDNLEVFYKRDSSPVTTADRASEKIIVEGLRKLTPGFPVIAEEEMASGRKVEFNTDAFWLVDPLDGTKEFIAHRDEFTVNIALIEDNLPTIGVVLAPARAALYTTSGPGEVSCQIGKGVPKPISAAFIPKKQVIAIGSRSHGNRKKMQNLLKERQIEKVLICGSSIKFCLVACGKADVYPRYGNTHEWDTAAGHAILSSAGGSVKTLDGKELSYGKKSFLNPEFIAFGKIK